MTNPRRQVESVQLNPNFQPFDPKSALIGNDELVTNTDALSLILKSNPRDELLDLAIQTLRNLDEKKSPEGTSKNVMQHMYEKGVTMFEKILTPAEFEIAKQNATAPDQFGDMIMRHGWV